FVTHRHRILREHPKPLCDSSGTPHYGTAIPVEQLARNGGPSRTWRETLAGVITMRERPSADTPGNPFGGKYSGTISRVRGNHHEGNEKSIKTIARRKRFAWR
ncbi:MAG: hypothetical protein ACRD4M_00135, partial [Candidatus Acidiferrales bacterium]